MIELQFQSAMTAIGLVVHEKIIPDGKIHRIYIEGDSKGSKNGWYVLFIDGVPSGAFGSWKAGVKGKWCAKALHDLTHEERAEHKRRMDAACKARGAEDQATKQAARAKAAYIWRISDSAAADNHTYLIRKGVKNYGLRYYKGCLVIPMYDSASTLHSLQFIDAEGNKRFLSGGLKKGCYFPIGAVGDTVCIAEGLATAASIHEASGLAVAVALDAGNILPVAQALRKKFPNTKIIICADNDIHTPGNPGLTKAAAAACAVGGFITYPEAAQ